MRKDGQVNITVTQETREWLRREAAASGDSIMGWLEKARASRELLAPAEAPRASEPPARVATVLATLAEKGLPVATAGEYVPPVADAVYQPVPAPVAKACGCGGRGGVAAPYRALSRRHASTCPFYSMKEE